MFIKNSFQTTALIWILSLGKKFKLSEFEEKPHYVLIKSHADGGGHTALALDEGRC